LIETIISEAFDIDVHQSIPIIAATALIQVGIKIVDEKNKIRAEMRKNPFAYIYEASKAGIL